MVNLEKSIKEKFVKLEDYLEICTAFKGTKQDNGIYKGGKYEEDIKNEWQLFEIFQIGKTLKNIFQNIMNQIV